MTAMNDMLRWCSEEIIMLEKIVKKLLDGGKIFTNSSGALIDDTRYWMLEYQKRIDDLKDIMIRYNEN